MTPRAAILRQQGGVDPLGEEEGAQGVGRRLGLGDGAQAELAPGGAQGRGGPGVGLDAGLDARLQDLAEARSPAP